MELHTYALKIAYDGAAFRGWQRQPGQPTAQEAIEGALASLLGERVRAAGAARTDAGVHAAGQVVSFSVRRTLEPARLAALPLPDGLRVVAAAAAPRSFHARASAAGKRYRYRFAWGPPDPGAFHLGAAPPDWSRARAALERLRGLPHLAGLGSPSTGRSPAPPLDEWTLEVEPPAAVLTVRARSFRKHEVRNLAGHLAAVALGLAAPESLEQLARGHRPWRGATAPAHGLTLVEVLYPEDVDPFLGPG